jgi:ankyrin repeat protein
MPLHWAAGTGFDEAVELLLNSDIVELSDDARDVSLKSKLSVDQPAHHPSTSRTPLHYAARNGHLSTCQLLISRYNADPHPKCGRGAVTPIQLAVWQNRLSIVKYLVDVNADRGNTVVFERNGFNCGLMHWLGLVPMKRWCGDGVGNSDNNASDDGCGVLPLARYLHSLGLTYESTKQNCNSQGHTPNHKAAWGGNLALIKYFRDEHGVYDSVQDEAGNYCADIAKMRGNAEVYQWLLDHGSVDRAESYRLLDLEVGADMESVKRRYFELAREYHPDKMTKSLVDDCNYIPDVDTTFLKIKAAYEHLTKENGTGRQRNPKYDEIKLLENHHVFSSDNLNCNSDDMFMARLLTVISDYGDEGFPLSLISRRWNQIWPDRPFPTDYVIEYQAKSQTDACVKAQKKVNLLRWLKWKCKGSNICFCSTERGVVLVDKAKLQKQ